MEKNGLYKTAALCVIVFSATAALCLSMKYAAALIAPFLFAALTAALIRPASSVISKKSRLPYKLCACTVTALFLFFIVYGLINAGGILVKEASSAISGLLREMDREDNALRRVFAYFSSLRDRIPMLSDSGDGGFSDGIYSAVVEAVKRGAAKLSESITAFAASFIGGMPGFVFSLVVYVVALFYLTTDPKGVREGIKKILPKSATNKLSGNSGAGWLRAGIAGALAGYVRAYLALMALTFAELLFGFVILRVRYAFLAAALIAVIDVLPVLGVGSVLVPWACASFLLHDVKRGIGLLVLFVIMYAVRQFAEPRLIGRFMGIHPLVALGAAFTGLKLFGIFGMIAMPLILYVIKLWSEESGRINEDAG